MIPYQTVIGSIFCIPFGYSLFPYRKPMYENERRKEILVPPNGNRILLAPVNFHKVVHANTLDQKVAKLEIVPSVSLLTKSI